MASRSNRKFVARTGGYYSFKEKCSVGQWIRKLNKKECTLDQVPENIKKMIHTDKPGEVAVEVAADNAMDDLVVEVPAEHIHDEHCQHDDPVQQALVDGAVV
jgi:hypothetical protein